MSGLVVVTRPEPDASDYAAELRAEGFDVFVEPMLALEAIVFDTPDLSQYDGILATSANALRFYKDGGGEIADVPVYCVGKHTAGMAQDIGFKDVISVSGTGADLLAYVLALPDVQSQNFLHICGQYVAFPLVERLVEDGITADSLKVYESVQSSNFSEAFFENLKGGNVNAVTFFSKRTAEAFVRSVRASESESLFAGIKALSISELVVECVRVLPWQASYGSKTPDRVGMMQLLKAYVSNNGKKEGARSMSKNGIENAEGVIEAFGGIRPMAKKIDVAVTTVQGWKKRNVIPAKRLELILKAAQEHDVDLGDLIDGSTVANENVSKPSSIVPAASSEDVDDGEGDALPETVVLSSDVKAEKPRVEEKTAEDKVLTHQADSFDKPPVSSGLKFVLVAAIVIALGFVAIAAYFWQKANTERAAEAARIAELEKQLSEADTTKDEDGFLGNIIPKDLKDRVQELQEQAEIKTQELQDAAEGVQEIAKAVSDDVLAEDAGNLGERLTKLETHIQDITGKPVLEGMLSRVEALQVSPEGNDLLARTVVELDALFEALQQDAVQGAGVADQAINSTLDTARAQSDALGQSFDAVPQEDLKAAAMLLGMAQLRSALNRDNAAFENDLALLKKVVGEENSALNDALDRLSPHAEAGVLTPAGLSDELRSFAGDAVAASLAGEDVSVQERAKARMNELFSVQKDGELITGTDTQASLLRAEQQLQTGDIAGAIESVQGLDGSAADVLLPWLTKAGASLDAQSAKNIVVDAIDGAVGGGQLIRNEELGINIYTPQKSVTY
jgi:uroporphyrinogen-III synthase/uncharacterized protein YoxC